MKYSKNQIEHAAIEHAKEQSPRSEDHSSWLGHGGDWASCHYFIPHYYNDGSGRWCTTSIDVESLEREGYLEPKNA